MKRLYIGVCVLLILLLLGLFISLATEYMYTPVSQLLEEATQAALSDNFAFATQKMEEAKKLWEHYKAATATVADHTPMEEIDHMFSEAHIYAKSNDTPHFAACCAQLSVMVRDMADAHSMNLWNLL